MKIPNRARTKYNLPIIRLDEKATAFIQGLKMQPGTKVYKMGKARIMLSPPTGKVGWHMSISREDKLPSWEEVSEARYKLMPKDIICAMILPPEEEYINIHEFCLQVHELDPVEFRKRE